MVASMGAQLRKWILTLARSLSLSRNYIYKQRMFLVQSNLFLLFFFFLFYCILLSSPRSHYFSLLILSFSIRKQHIYIYIFFFFKANHGILPLDAHIRTRRDLDPSPLGAANCCKTLSIEDRYFLRVLTLQDAPIGGTKL